MSIIRGRGLGGGGRRRRLHQIAKRGLSTRVLKSPSSLASLDLPDVWAHSPSSSSLAPPSPNLAPKQQSAVIIDGKAIADGIRCAIAGEVRRMRESIGKVPGLGVIVVGHRKDSQTYVSNKVKACEETGIRSLITQLPVDCTEHRILDALSCYNQDASVHGVLVQLPLPRHLDEGKILDMVSLEKDVDGFHPVNMGNLAMKGGEPLFIPCTPKGCVELLIRSGVDIRGKHAVVIGRSNIVGMPTSLLLQRYHATVSVVHAFTKNPEHVTSEADIVISAAGVPNLVRGNWLKPGAVVVDVGTCPVEDANADDGYRLSGDVCFDEAVHVASRITPVPGGVGPMTIAMLLSNTLDAAKRAYGFFDC